MGEILSAGAITIDDISKGITIYSDSIKDTFSTFEHPLGTFYQVPENKILRLGLFYYSGDTVKTKICIGYGDDTVSDSVTPPTNLVEFIHQLPLDIADSLKETKLLINIPALKYPSIHATTGFGACIAVGYLEDV